MKPGDQQLFDAIAAVWAGDRDAAFLSLNEQGVKITKRRLKSIVESDEFAVLLQARAVKPKKPSGEEDDTIASATEVKQFWTGIMRDVLVDTADRLRASGLLAKMYGMLTEKHEISGDMKFSIADILDADLKPNEPADPSKS